MTIDRDRVDRRVVIDCANTSMAGILPPRIFVSSGGSFESFKDFLGSTDNSAYVNQIMELVSLDAPGGYPFRVHDIFGSELDGTLYSENATYYLGDDYSAYSYTRDPNDPNSVYKPIQVDSTLSGKQRDHPALARFDVDGDFFFGVGDDPRVSVHYYWRNPTSRRWVLKETIQHTCHDEREYLYPVADITPLKGTTISVKVNREYTGSYSTPFTETPMFMVGCRFTNFVEASYAASNYYDLVSYGISSTIADQRGAPRGRFFKKTTARDACNLEDGTQIKVWQNIVVSELSTFDLTSDDQNSLTVFKSLPPAVFLQKDDDLVEEYSMSIAWTIKGSIGDPGYDSSTGSTSLPDIGRIIHFELTTQSSSDTVSTDSLDAAVSTTSKTEFVFITGVTAADAGNSYADYTYFGGSSMKFASISRAAYLPTASIVLAGVPQRRSTPYLGAIGTLDDQERSAESPPFTEFPF